MANYHHVPYFHCHLQGVAGYRPISEDPVGVEPRFFYTLRRSLLRFRAQRLLRWVRVPNAATQCSTKGATDRCSTLRSYIVSISMYIGISNNIAKLVYVE